MRLITTPIVALALTAGSSGEPSELEMRLAFQENLSAQVQSVLDYIVETRGAEGLAFVRTARTDRFEIRSFTKLRCEHTDRMSGHVCRFAVDIATVNGAVKQTETGCFIPRPSTRRVFFLQGLRQASDGNDPVLSC